MVKLDNPFSYALLLVLSIFGFLSLVALLMTGLWKTIGKAFRAKFQFTFMKGKYKRF